MFFRRVGKTFLMGICGSYQGTGSSVTNAGECVAVRHMDTLGRLWTSFMSGPGRAPLGDNVSVRGGERR